MCADCCSVVISIYNIMLIRSDDNFDPVAVDSASERSESYLIMNLDHTFSFQPP
jgi:hypothetical protein